MLTSKDRAQLRAEANLLDTTLIVGKGGITEALIAEAEILLRTHELVKAKVLDAALLSPQEACDTICRATGAEGVQIVGTKFVFYKKSEQLEEKRMNAAKKAVKPAKKSNPVRAGVQARRKKAREEKQKRDQYFHDAAVKAAIEKRKAADKR